MAKTKNGLTYRQDLFASYYAQYRNGHKAAVKAGYKASAADVTSSRMLRNVKIRALIDKREAEANNKSIAGNTEAKQFLTRVLRGQEHEYDTGSGIDGEYKIEKPPDIKDRIKAAEDLIKHNSSITHLEYERTKASLEKVQAEAEIKKYEAKQNNSAQNKTINQTTKLLNKLEKATKDNPKKN